MSSLVSVLVPLYNEAEFIVTTLERIIHAALPEAVRLEIVVVDDGSKDESAALVEEFARRHPGVEVRLYRHERNRGKGAAIRTALAHARGEWALIQDADLEYNPREYPRLLAPLIEHRADAVYGSRFLVAGERRVLYFWHALANHALTTVCNMVADLNLTDMETGYKAFRTSLVASIPLRSERFGIEPELTIKLAQRQSAIYELPISYYGRTYLEGKKIGFRDALQALWIIARFGVSRDIYLDPGARMLDALASTPKFNRWMADTIRPWVGERVLEIGAGIGNLTAELSPRRKRYLATDIDPEHLARLQTRFSQRPAIEIRRCDLEQSEDFAPLAGQLDTVVCLNVLEHVERDVDGLRHIRSALAPGGRAVILVPEGPSIYGTLDHLLGHCRRYREAELREKMTAAGFRLERILHFNRVTRPAWFLNGRLLRRRGFGRAQLLLFDRLVWLWRRIDRILPWKPVSLIAIGVRDS